METKTNSADCLSRLVLEDHFTILYAEAVRDKTHEIARRVCFGCLTDHLSQTQHSCITLTPDQKLKCYFVQALQDIDEQEIIRRWNDCVSRVDLKSQQTLENYSHKYHSHHWRETMLKTDRWRKKLFQTVRRMIHLEKRFYN